MRDFRAELAGERCWDAGVEKMFLTPPHVLPDALLQNREELVALCEWMEGQNVRSYLEIGCWTGRLMSALHRLFAFERMASCDIGIAEALGMPSHLPPSCVRHHGSSHAAPYRVFRSTLGHMDMVVIDGDHTYEGVKKDFEINVRHPHRFLVFHDISGRRASTEGVKRFWDELGGNKVEIVKPHVELGLPHTTMGIGVWWR